MRETLASVIDSTPASEPEPSELAGTATRDLRDRLRAMQVQAVLTLTPVVVVSNLVGVATLCWTFRDSAPPWAQLAWAALVILTVAWGARAWWRAR
ncbi:MAG TPA: hypothetical protein VGD46_05940, partial [Rhizobacter sp.]